MDLNSAQFLHKSHDVFVVVVSGGLYDAVTVTEYGICNEKYAVRVVFSHQGDIESGHYDLVLLKTDTITEERVAEAYDAWKRDVILHNSQGEDTNLEKQIVRALCT